MLDTYEFFHYFTFWKSSKDSTPLSKKHIKILQNSVYNVFFNSGIRLNEGDNKYFQRHSKNLKALASKFVDDEIKQEIVKKNSALIKRIGAVVITYLDEQ
jgi:Zn-dependent oligopeptidase